MSTTEDVAPAYSLDLDPRTGQSVAVPTDASMPVAQRLGSDYVQLLVRTGQLTSGGMRYTMNRAEALALGHALADLAAEE